MWLARPGRLKLRTEGRDKQHRHSLDLCNGQVEKLTGGRVGPMQILEDNQHRSLARQTGELSQQRIEYLALLALRREVESGIAVVERNGQQFGQ